MRINCLSTMRVASLLTLFAFVIAAGAVASENGHGSDNNSGNNENSNKKENVYAQLSSMKNQITGVSIGLVEFEHKDAISGLQLLNKNKIVIEQDGTYFVSFKGQVGSLGLNLIGDVSAWLEVNEQAVKHTQAIQSIVEKDNSSTLAFQHLLLLKEGDTLSLGFASTLPSLGLILEKDAKGKTIPSASLSIFKIKS